MEATETKFKEDVNNFRAVEEPVEGEDGELRAAAKQVGAWRSQLMNEKPKKNRTNETAKRANLMMIKWKRHWKVSSLQLTHHRLLSIVAITRINPR